MNISFKYANRSNTSVLLKFDGIIDNQTLCLLVDAGEGTDVDSLINEDENEFLAGILLTHLHLDHYISLDENLRDNTRIYTSKENEKILNTVLSEANSNRTNSFNTHQIQSSVTPITDSITIGDALTITPVPAGHTPGATGFYIQFGSDGDTETILITGDFTRRTVAGYSGLPLHETDTLILTGATADSFQDSITSALDKALEHGVSGSPTLVTASGLNCVHFTYLLGHLLDRTSSPSQVNIVGQAAKLYDALGYAVPNVNSIQEYDAGNVVGESYITVSGPDIPNSGGAKLLFDEIRHDPNAGLIQLVSGDRGDIADSQCTINRYVTVNHPTMETVENTIELLNPEQAIITHQTGDNLERYRDQLPTAVWAPKDNQTYTFYKDGEWTPPHWINKETLRKYNSSTQPIKLPAVAPDTDSFRRMGVDLGGEGVLLNNVMMVSDTNSSDYKYSTASTPNPGV
ncbi:MBL fold metallo-hydrolase [Halobacterium sp. KA-4]|uniref:MBL fold metallo-hydrolase n=1 Tax=Halobacterium sp. KA-4 TaxID=2896367 RepID=UPI001E5F8651|nr:MBL fold metallo-hydrolase [Halobacterium sp. KA-4]